MSWITDNTLAERIAHCEAAFADHIFDLSEADPTTDRWGKTTLGAVNVTRPDGKWATLNIFFLAAFPHRGILADEHDSPLGWWASRLWQEKYLDPHRS